MNKKVTGNLLMTGSKIFSGINASALKYIIPIWMSSMATVAARMIFGALAFWGVEMVRDIYRKKKGVETIKPTLRELKILLIIGSAGFYVFELCYLGALQFTTPVSVTVLGGLIPVWTFLGGVLIYKIEVFSWSKVVGLIFSFGGVIMSIFTKKPPEYASNPILGDILALINTFAYSLVLIYNKKILRKLDGLTVIKWIFTGAAISSIILGIICIWVLPAFGIEKAAELYKTQIFSSNTINWIPILVLLFILIFPTVLSYLMQQGGLMDLSATMVATYSNLLIIVSAITAIILGQDYFSWLLVGSMLCLFAGLYFISDIKKA